ncbi:hypothetical protein F4680DRAFT_436644 [Xylaria scruposa]|nr:hypothetical protein F4680DRAFT_436644 [Xylaria scruposa]
MLMDWSLLSVAASGIRSMTTIAPPCVLVCSTFDAQLRTKRVLQTHMLRRRNKNNFECKAFVIPKVVDPTAALDQSPCSIGLDRTRQLFSVVATGHVGYQHQYNFNYKTIPSASSPLFSWNMLSVLCHGRTSD